jgi:glycosyltransferase involved in cell wall biosynthesis
MIRIATNIFNSPANTGPGNFGRRLGVALKSYNVELLPERTLPNVDAYLANAFYDGPISKYPDIPSILRVDGCGRPGQERNRVEHAHANVDICIYQSNYSAKLLQKTFSKIPEKFHVIPNGIRLNTSWEYRSPKYRGIRLLSICHNWDKARYKNFMNVIVDNAKKIKSVFPTIRWQIVGKHQQFKDAMDIIPDWFDFIEFTTELDKLRRDATIFVHLVDTDSCPNSVIESLACGLPCIVWHNSAGPELAGEGGITLHSDSLLEIIDAINDIICRHEIYSIEARYQVERYLDIDKVASKYAKVFEDALHS